MFRKWLSENKIENYDFSGRLFPKACDREFWDSKYDEGYIRNAEKYMGYEWPVIRATAYMEFFKSGNRLVHEKPHFARRQALASLAMGEIMEHKGRFLPDIVDGIFAICEETYWGVSAHALPLIHKEAENLPDITSHVIDLFAAETASLISIIYYMLYDELYDFCPEILDRIEYEMDTRIMHPYATRKDYWWMGYNSGTTNNWNVWIISNVLTVFLLMPTTKTVFVNAFKKMLFEVNTYYNSMPNDGGCDEGATYWGKAGAKLFEFCDQIYIATNGTINFFNDEKIKNIGKFIYRVYIGNGYVTNFADGSPKIARDLNSIFYLYGKRIGDINLCSMSREVLELNKSKEQEFSLREFRKVLNDIIYKDEINALPKLNIEDCLLPDLQVRTVRKGDWFYAAKGGHNKESHNHNDVGSFIVYHNNRPVLIDPGCGVYTRQTFMVTERYKIWTMQSLWHNLPVVNGCQQLSEYDEGGGYEACADAFLINEKSTNISFAKAYPETAGLENINRSINISDDGINLYDNFAFKNEENSICEHLITVFDVKIDGSRVILGDEFVLETQDCDISADIIEFNGDTKLTDFWKTDHLNRIKCSFKCGKEKSIKFILARIK